MGCCSSRKEETNVANDNTNNTNNKRSQPPPLHPSAAVRQATPSRRPSLTMADNSPTTADMPVSFRALSAAEKIRRKEIEVDAHRSALNHMVGATPMVEFQRRCTEVYFLQRELTAIVGYAMLCSYCELVEAAHRDRLFMAQEERRSALRVRMVLAADVGDWYDGSRELSASPAIRRGKSAGGPIRSPTPLIPSCSAGRGILSPAVPEAPVTTLASLMIPAPPPLVVAGSSFSSQHQQHAVPDRAIVDLQRICTSLKASCDRFEKIQHEEQRRQRRVSSSSRTTTTPAAAVVAPPAEEALPLPSPSRGLATKQKGASSSPPLREESETQTDNDITRMDVATSTPALQHHNGKPLYVVAPVQQRQSQQTHSHRTTHYTSRHDISYSREMHHDPTTMTKQSNAGRVLAAQDQDRNLNDHHRFGDDYDDGVDPSWGVYQVQRRLKSLSVLSEL
eukprot:PhM_4_TR8284/c0_g1_i1/m.92654